MGQDKNAKEVSLQESRAGILKRVSRVKIRMPGVGIGEFKVTVSLATVREKRKKS